MKNKKKKNRPEPSAIGAVLAAPRGMLVFLIFSLIASLPASACAYLTDDPGRYVLPCGLAVLYLSAAAGGFAAYKTHGGLALLTGFFCGVACVAISLLLALVIPSAGLAPAALFLTRLPIVPMGIMGSYLASTKRKKKKKRK